MPTMIYLVLFAGAYAAYFFLVHQPRVRRAMAEHAAATAGGAYQNFGVSVLVGDAYKQCQLVLAEGKKATIMGVDGSEARVFMAPEFALGGELRESKNLELKGSKNVKVLPCNGQFENARIVKLAAAAGAVELIMAESDAARAIVWQG